jgi:peptidyl-prolyl cis-trans isomerase B (cyclophilin B)
MPFCTAPTAQGWGYCVFGKVVAGTEVIDAMRKVRTGNRAGHQNVPLEDIIITKAEVVK